MLLLQLFLLTKWHITCFLWNSLGSQLFHKLLLLICQVSYIILFILWIFIQIHLFFFLKIVIRLCLVLHLLLNLVDSNYNRSLMPLWKCFLKFAFVVTIFEDLLKSIFYFEHDESTSLFCFHRLRCWIELHSLKKYSLSSDFILFILLDHIFGSPSEY